LLGLCALLLVAPSGFPFGWLAAAEAVKSCCSEEKPESAQTAAVAAAPGKTEPKSCCASETTEAAPKKATGLRFPKVTLIDQDGQPVRLRDLEDKVLAINFVFTTCTTICPPMTANFFQLQKLMADRVNKDFQMISISLDPVNDTPARLKAFAQKFGAQPGWRFLTGSKSDVEQVLRALRVYTAAKEQHSPLIYIAAPAKQSWTQVNGLGAPAKLAEIARELLPQIGPQAAAPVQLKSSAAVASVVAAPQPAQAAPAIIRTSVEGPASQTPPASEPQSPAHKYFTDVELINQDGETQRFSLWVGRVAPSRADGQITPAMSKPERRRATERRALPTASRV
jgi:protein SCO1